MKYVYAFLVMVGFVALAALLVSWPVMALWNWLMPEIFGLKTITWTQALGLIALSSLLFKTRNPGKSDKE